jgi:small GTP-binding protein
MATYKFKVLITGPAAVGKTSLLNRFVKNDFKSDYASTIGAQFLTKEIEISSEEENALVNLSIWDVGGQPRFVDIRTTFYRGANGALMVYDLVREETFKELESWHAEMLKVLDENLPLVIIGNKSDLIKKQGRKVDIEVAKKFAKEKNSYYIETSAKTGMNVEKAFIELTRLIGKQRGAGFSIKRARREAFFIRSRVRDYFKSQGYLPSNDLVDGNMLNDIIIEILDKAIEKAKAAGRNTVLPEDI